MPSRMWLAIVAAAVIALAGCGRHENYEGVWHRVEGQNLPKANGTIPADIRITRKDNATYVITEIGARPGKAPANETGSPTYRREIRNPGIYYDRECKALLLRYRSNDDTSPDIVIRYTR